MFKSRKMSAYGDKEKLSQCLWPVVYLLFCTTGQQEAYEMAQEERKISPRWPVMAPHGPT